MKRKLITERIVIEAVKSGNKTIMIPPDALITALARDKAKQLGATFQTLKPQTVVPASTTPTLLKQGAERKVALGADHGGFPLKEFLKKTLTEMQFTIVDVGTHSTESVDYPDFAEAVAHQVASGECFRGIMIDGAGIGSCMVANKVAGVRAAMCYDITTAVNSREHNNANVLTLGSKMIGETVAEHIVKVFLKTEFAGGRHQGRIDKMMAVERKR